MDRIRVVQQLDEPRRDADLVTRCNVTGQWHDRRLCRGGADNGLWEKTYNSGSWSGWTSIAM